MTQPVQTASPTTRGLTAGADGSTGADTNIYINTHDPVAPPTTLAPVEKAPVIAPPPPSVINQTTNVTAPEPQPPVAIADIPRNYATTTETRTETTLPAPAEYATHTDTVTKKSINWGKVVKGAAIVLGVVAVAVVGFYALSALTTWALGTETGAAIYTAVSPAVTAAGEGLSWFGGFVGHVPAAIGAFFSHALGLSAASAAATTTAAALAPGTIAAASTTAGYIGAGLAGATGVVMATPALEHLNVTDHATTTIAHTVPVDPGTLDAHHHTVGQDQFVPNPNMLATKNTLITHEAMNHDLAHASHTAAELGHHSLHATAHHPTDNHHFIGHSTDHREHTDHDQAAGSDDSMPDTPDDGPQNSARRRSWREKLLGSSQNSYQQAYQTSGSHSTAVQASGGGRNAGTITPRDANFATALNDDRARLETALGEPTR